jgi:hypothetical protein
MSDEKEISKFEKEFKRDIIEISVKNPETEDHTQFVGIDVTKFNAKQKNELIRLLKSNDFEEMIEKTCTCGG